METPKKEQTTSQAKSADDNPSASYKQSRTGVIIYKLSTDELKCDAQSQLIFDTCSDGVCSVDSLLGRTAGLDPKQLKEMLRATRKDGLVRELEFRMDNTIVDFELYQCPMYVDECIIRVRQTEDQWKERLYPRLLHRIEDSIITVDEHGIIRFWNRGAERIFGFKKAEMEGHHIDKLVPEFDANRLRKMHEDQIPFVTNEWSFELDGEQRWVRVTVSVISDDYGQFQGVVGVSKDITEVKNLTLKNKRQNQLLEQIYNVQNLGVIVVDVHGSIRSANKKAKELVNGISGVHLEKGMSFDLIEHSDIPKLKEMIQLLRSDEEFVKQIPIKVNNEMHWYRLELFWLELEGEDTDQGVLGMSFTDITKLKQQEISLQESRTRFQRLFENSVLGMVLCDLTGKILDANAAFDQMIGEQVGATIGKEMDSLVHEDDLETAQQQLFELVSGKKTNDQTDFWKRFIHKDGEVVHTHLFTSLIRDFSGKPDYIFAVFQDVTEDVMRKSRIRELNEELRLNEARYRKLFDQSQDTVVQLDAEGKVLDVTSSVENLLGYPPDAIIGLSSYAGRNFQRKDGMFIMDFLKNNPGIPLVFQSELRDKSGENRWLEFSLVNRLDVKEVKCIIATLRDVTVERELFLQQKEFLQRLEVEKRAMSELHQLKSAFLSNMSHEIRTPINGIIGISNLIKDETNNPDIKEYALIQEQSSLRLLETVNSILEMAKLEAKAASFEEHEVVDSNVLKEIIKPFAVQAEKRGLAMKMEILDDIYVQCDKGMFNLIVNNLLSNAIKFTKQGQIDIKLDMVDARPTLTVKDTGIGMSKSFQERVFKPFEQESTGYSRKFEGTGLGLAITKQYVEMNGGTISLCSKRNVGSTFTVTFKGRKGKPLS